MKHKLLKHKQPSGSIKCVDKTVWWEKCE